jgi:hypothetical protein
VRAKQWRAKDSKTEQLVRSLPERLTTPTVVADQEAPMKIILAATAAFVILGTPALADETPSS